MTNELTVEARVANGAAFLDEHYPGWETKIDLSRLSLESCESCVIGQAVREYEEFLDTNEEIVGQTGKEQWEWGGSNGFCTTVPWKPEFRNEFAYLQEEDYRALDAAWTSLIKERFDSGILSG